MKCKSSISEKLSFSKEKAFAESPQGGAPATLWRSMCAEAAGCAYELLALWRVSLVGVGACVIMNGAWQYGRETI